MRLATRDEDGWALRSAEAAHARNSATFWIPEPKRRRALEPGHGVKLLFEIVSERRGEPHEVSIERMWVIVGERVGDRFLGRLVTQPASLEPGGEHYLRVGSEIPFGPEHVADIDRPPKAFAERVLSAPPAKRWPPEERE